MTQRIKAITDAPIIRDYLTSLYRANTTRSTDLRSRNINKANMAVSTMCAKGAREAMACRKTLGL